MWELAGELLLVPASVLQSVEESLLGPVLVSPSVVEWRWGLVSGQAWLSPWGAE